MKHTAKILSVIAIATLPATVHAGAYGSSAVRDASVSNSAASGGTVWCNRISADVPRRLASEMDCGSSAAPRRGLRGFIASLSGPRSDTRDDSRNDNDNDDVVRRPLPPTTTVSVDPEDTPPGDTPPSATPPTDTPPTDTPTSDFVSKADRLADFGTTFDTLGEKSDQFQSEAREYREEHGGRGNWADFSPSTPD